MNNKPDNNVGVQFLSSRRMYITVPLLKCVTVVQVCCQVSLLKIFTNMQILDFFIKMTKLYMNLS